MNGGVTFVAIFGGSLFFTCSDRERGRNADKMAQRKNKIKLKLRANTKFKLIETHKVCVCRVCVVGRNGPIRGERRTTSCCREPTSESDLHFPMSQMTIN